MKRAACLALLAPIFLAACASMSSNNPLAQARLRIIYAGESRQVEAMLAEVPSLLALSADDAKREQQAAAAALAASNAEVERVRLALLLSLGVGGRNDSTLVALLEETTTPPPSPESPLQQLRLLLQKMTVDRLRTQHEAQIRAEARLREVETRLREAMTRADSLQQKLDALVDLERTLNQRYERRKKEKP